MQSYQRHHHQIKKISKRGKKRVAIGAPPHRPAQKAKTSRASGHLNSKSRPLSHALPPSSSSSPHFFHRFAPRISNPNQPYRRRPAGGGSPTSASSAMNNFHVYEAIGRGKHSVTLPHFASPAPLLSVSVPLLPPGSRPGSARIGAAQVPARAIFDFLCFFHGRLCDLVLVAVRNEDGV